MLTAAIESWRKEDRELGLSVRPREAAVRAELQNLYGKLSTLMATPEAGALYVTSLPIARHLERILRYSISIAEQSAAAAPLAQAGEQAFAAHGAAPLALAELSSFGP
jgi:phosphate uptake regulator